MELSFLIRSGGLSTIWVVGGAAIEAVEAVGRADVGASVLSVRFVVDSVAALVGVFFGRLASGDGAGDGAGCEVDCGGGVDGWADKEVDIVVDG